MLPTVVKFGAEILVKKLSSKMRDPFTLAKDGMLTFETFRNVMLFAQIRLGKLTSKLRPFEAMLTPWVMLPICVLNVRRRLLLLMSSKPTVIKLIPSRVLKKVFVMVTLTALEMKEGKVSWDRAGRAAQLMVPTCVSSVN